MAVEARGNYKKRAAYPKTDDQDSLPATLVQTFNIGNKTTGLKFTEDLFIRDGMAAQINYYQFAAKVDVCRGIVLFLRTVATKGVIRIHLIRNLTPGNNLIIATVDKEVSAIDKAGGPTNFDFGSNIQLVPGESYSLVPVMISGFDPTKPVLLGQVPFNDDEYKSCITTVMLPLGGSGFDVGQRFRYQVILNGVTIFEDTTRTYAAIIQGPTRENSIGYVDSAGLVRDETHPVPAHDVGVQELLLEELDLTDLDLIGIPLTNAMGFDSIRSGTGLNTTDTALQPGDVTTPLQALFSRDVNTLINARRSAAAGVGSIIITLRLKVPAFMNGITIIDGGSGDGFGADKVKIEIDPNSLGEPIFTTVYDTTGGAPTFKQIVYATFPTQWVKIIKITKPANGVGDIIWQEIIGNKVIRTGVTFIPGPPGLSNVRIQDGDGLALADVIQVTRGLDVLNALVVDTELELFTDNVTINNIKNSEFQINPAVLPNGTLTYFRPDTRGRTIVNNRPQHIEAESTLALAGTDDADIANVLITGGPVMTVANFAKLKFLRIIGKNVAGPAYTSYDVEIYDDSDFLYEHLRFQALGIVKDANGIILILSTVAEIMYRDNDALGEVHLRVKGNGGGALSTENIVFRVEGERTIET